MLRSNSELARTKWKKTAKRIKQFLQKRNPLAFFCWLFVVVHQLLPVLLVRFASYAKRNEHARLLIVAKTPTFRSNESTHDRGTPSCIFEIHIFIFRSSIDVGLEPLLFTTTLFSSSKLRALKIIVIIYVDKFCNIMAKRSFAVNVHTACIKAKWRLMSNIRKQSHLFSQPILIFANSVVAWQTHTHTPFRRSTYRLLGDVHSKRIPSKDYSSAIAAQTSIFAYTHSSVIETFFRIMIYLCLCALFGVR